MTARLVIAGVTSGVGKTTVAEASSPRARTGNAARGQDKEWRHDGWGWQATGGGNG